MFVRVYVNVCACVYECKCVHCGNDDVCVRMSIFVRASTASVCVRMLMFVRASTNPWGNDVCVYMWECLCVRVATSV